MLGMTFRASHWWHITLVFWLFLTFQVELQNLMQQCPFARFWQGQAGLVKGLRYIIVGHLTVLHTLNFKSHVLYINYDSWIVKYYNLPSSFARIIAPWVTPWISLMDFCPAMFIYPSEWHPLTWRNPCNLAAQSHPIETSTAWAGISPAAQATANSHKALNGFKALKSQEKSPYWWLCCLVVTDWPGCDSVLF